MNVAFWWLLIPTAMLAFLVGCAFVVEVLPGWIRRVHRNEAGRRSQHAEWISNGSQYCQGSNR